MAFDFTSFLQNKNPSVTSLTALGSLFNQSQLIGDFGGSELPEPSGQQFSIENFRQHLSAHNEIAKADKFDVYITLPDSVAESVRMQDIALLAHTSELPGRDVTMIEYRHHAFIKRVPHFNQYGQANFTFYCTGDFLEKRLFDRWLDIMVPAQTGLASYAQDSSGRPVYETIIHCNQYDQRGEFLYVVDLIDAIPLSVSPMIQSWNNDSVHELQVTFAFTKWLTSETKYKFVSDVTTVSPNVFKPPSDDTNNQTNNVTNVNNGPNPDQRS